jgi:sugar lactone lactonase YvrE
MKQILQFAASILFFTCLLISCKKTMSIGGNGGNNSGGGGTGSNNSPDTVSTYAGSGILGLVNGADSVAQFAGPTGVAVDLQGNLYVLDAQNYVIRKITPAGQVSTLAGNGNQGFVNGPGATAEFSSPNGIAVDAQGNVYVSEGMDDNYNRIREISPSGVVSTFAGRGTFGFRNGTGDGSAFFTPAGMAFDAQGNLYVADQYNNCIRRITPGGVVSTFAGNGKQGALDGPADSAEFSVPSDVTVDLLGNVYVADNYNAEIRKITPSGLVSTLAGSVNNTGSADGTGASAEFVSPQAITIDGQQNIYETDGINNSSIRKITTSGVVTTLAGNVDGGFMNGPYLKAMFSSPSGLAVDTKGNIYVADQGNNMIRKITLQ